MELEQTMQLEELALQPLSPLYPLSTWRLMQKSWTLDNIVSHLVKVVLWVQWPSSDTVTIIAQLSRHHRGTWLLLAALGNKLERVREMKPYLCGPVTKLEHRSCCPKKNCWSAFFSFYSFLALEEKRKWACLGKVGLRSPTASEQASSLELWDLLGNKVHHTFGSWRFHDACFFWRCFSHQP